MPRAQAPTLPNLSDIAPDAPPGLFSGTSGWAYPTWKPGFYPAKLPARSFLSHYASRLNTVEVNYTFRTLPTEAMLTGWLAQTGPGFRFSFKAPQRITHFSRLRACDEHLQAFFTAIRLAADAGKLGLVLFQLPPNLKLNAVLLKDFLASPILTQGPHLAFEFRHESWFTEEIYDLLRERNAALCIADTDELATPEIHTARTHTCFRLRRDGGYTPAELAAFAAQHLALTRAGREVYTHFRHQEAPTGALNATEYLHQGTAVSQANGEPA